ncbi:DNA-3-methyladenine glycosylase 2 family protein [Candidatus Saccharibacteria bacterium]|nr:DNA-3-methyladenine glycosylase 2 family protein [Candidatus Saccharibacteria bacterium]
MVRKVKNAVASEDTARLAANHLAKNDPVLAPLIEQFGLCTIRPHQDYYRELVESIVGQQLSVKAAASIRKKFLELFGGTFPEPELLLQKSVEELRSVGFSGAKVRYVQDLAQNVLEGKVKFEEIDELSNKSVVSELTAGKGIGEWTAHMFLMFCMGRLDVLPVGDLGIRNGIQRLYGLSTLPGPDEIKAVAIQGNWHPYESIAAWYIWQSLDNTPK